MSMTPEEKNRLEMLEKTVRELLNVSNIQFIKNLERRLPIKPHKLSEHLDVEDTDDALTGEILKKTATTWQPGTDNVV